MYVCMYACMCVYMYTRIFVGSGLFLEELCRHPGRWRSVAFTRLASDTQNFLAVLLRVLLPKLGAFSQGKV